MQKRYLELRKNDGIEDILLLLEHPNTYTLGKTANKNNLIGDEKFLNENNFSVYETDRGGDITYHGPGQIVGYPIFDLKNWKQDAHLYLRTLEDVIIDVCCDYGVIAGRNKNYTGVWIGDKKICAIGIKISSWIAMHGFALNINPDLAMFSGIIPCGIKGKEVTSLKIESGKEYDIEEVKRKILKYFSKRFSYNIIEGLPDEF